MIQENAPIIAKVASLELRFKDLNSTVNALRWIINIQAAFIGYLFYQLLI